MSSQSQPGEEVMVTSDFLLALFQEDVEYKEVRAILYILGQKKSSNRSVHRSVRATEVFACSAGDVC